MEKEKEKEQNNENEKEKEEKIEDQVQNFINNQISEIKEETKKEKISIVLNKITSLNITEFQINIDIPDTSTHEIYQFIVEINLIYNKIHLYSLNIKEFSDSRDLYSYVIQKKENFNDNFIKDKFNLKNLVKNLKNFVQNLSEIRKNSKKIGNFYLFEEYDIITIKSLKNILQIPCRKVEFIKGKKIKIPALCCISNDYFILYEYGNSSNKYLSNDEYKFTLVFYASIDSLIKFKKLFEGPAISFLFQKNEKDKSEFYLKLESDIDKDINLLIDNLIEKMKISGMKVDIIDKKYGEVPKIDIKEIEQKISKYELELQKNGTKELFNDLLKSYEQAIVFYSAINDKQYVTYSTRVKELLKNEKYAKYLS